MNKEEKRGRPTSDKTKEIRASIKRAIAKGEDLWSICVRLSAHHKVTRQWVNYLLRNIAPELPRLKKSATKQCIVCKLPKRLESFGTNQRRCSQCIDEDARRCTKCGDTFHSKDPKSYCMKCVASYHKEWTLTKKPKEV